MVTRVANPRKSRHPAPDTSNQIEQMEQMAQIVFGVPNFYANLPRALLYLPHCLLSVWIYTAKAKLAVLL